MTTGSGQDVLVFLIVSSQLSNHDMYTCVKGIDFVYVSTIFLLDFETILTWPRIFLFFILSMN